MNTKKNTVKIISAAIIGHILEFYDFTIYAVFAVKIGSLFFPNSSEFAQILSSLAVFAVGFFMRPVGGLVFGHIGDRYGRRKALTISVLGMACVTFAMGFMPDYAAIGIAAPILLVACRLLQGLCVGGEGAGASIFVLEHLHGIRPGLVGGIVNAALTAGILLAIFTGMFLNNYLGVDSNAWRFAFVLGGFLGIAGLYLRLTVAETPVFEKMQNEERILEAPIREVFRKNFKNAILTVAVGGLTGASGYLIMTYLNVFFKSIMAYDANTALYYAALGNFLLIIFLPIGGILADRIGYSRTILIGSLLIFFVSIPIFSMLASNNPFEIHLGIIGLAAIVGTIYAPLYPFMLAMFTPEQRYSGIACCLNIGIALMGGTCSMICLWLIEKTGQLYATAYYWNFVSAVFLVTLYLVRPNEFFGYFLPHSKSRKTELQSIIN